MSDLTRGDVQQVVQDTIHEMKDDVRRIRDEQHRELERLRLDSEDMKQRIQNIEHGMQQTIQYLQTMTQSKDQGGDSRPMG